MKYTKVQSFRVHRMVSDPRFKRMVDRPHRISKEYDVPYLAGYSKDDKTIYIDRHLPAKMPDGKDPIPHLVVHEKVEKALEDLFNLPYQEAHHIALHFEQQSVEKAGINWDSYSKFMDKYIKLDGHEKLQNVPKDLDLKPYKDERDNKLMFKLRKIEGVTAKNKGGH